MTTSGQMQFLSEILEWKPVPQDTLVYFRERLRHRLHATILDAFARRAEERGLKQSDLAKRIHRKRAQIARWLSTQSNLTLDSISDLMVGLGMDFDAFPFTPIEKTVTAAHQQVGSEKPELGKALRKVLHKFERTLALNPPQQISLSFSQHERSFGMSATALAPSPSSGAMASTVAEALKKRPSAEVIDFAARAQKRTEQIAQKTREQKRTFPKNGVAA
jgi:transcriptional regulator with XRE-family HTH domain